MSDKSKWKVAQLAVSVYHEDEGSPIFGESAYHVSVGDNGGGPYVTINNSADDIKPGCLELDLEALQLITEEAAKLMKIHEELKKDIEFLEPDENVTAGPF